MRMTESSIRIFDYTDYRKFLADFYTEQKKVNRAFSYRYFARKAELSSIGFYKDVVEGRQKLGRSMIRKFSKAIGLKKREAGYFEALVFFDEARTVEERKMYFNRMMDFAETKTRILDRTQYEYHARWYYSAVRELLSFYRFTDDYTALAKKLVPAIRVSQARKAIRVLLDLGLIRKNDSGWYERTDQVISTGVLSASDKGRVVNVINFQKTTRELADRAYDRFDTRQIDMSTLTISISGETCTAIKKELQAFRKKILAMASRDEAPDRVYQINCNVFPLTDIKEEN